MIRFSTRWIVVLAVAVLACTGCGQTETYLSPDRSMEVSVQKSSAPPDTLWIVRLTTQSSSAGQEIGCLSDDSPEGQFLTVDWIDRSSFVIRTTIEENDITVSLNSSSGARPVVKQRGEALRDCNF
jgi:hypothetical protein